MKNLKEFLKKVEDYNIVYWLLVAIFIISLFSLLIVYAKDYIYEAHLARTLPMSIFSGLIAIATSLYKKK